MNVRFATSRLLVAPWGLSKARESLHRELAAILDEDVTAFLPESLQFRKGETSVAAWADTFGSGNNQVSSVRLLNKDDGDEKQQQQPLAGLLLLRPEDESDSIMHLGYIFGKSYWGRGLATELLRGLVDHLTEVKYSGVLHAGVAKGNPASVKVLQKVGFAPMEKSCDEKDSDVDWFSRSFKT